MRILNVTAQKPHSTGSGVYLTETVRQFAALGHQTAVVAGVCAGDSAVFPEGTAFYPVYYKTPALPFPVCGMSDEMPYESTVYRSMSEEMTGQFECAFSAALIDAAADFKPDVIICHHLYLLAALTRRLFPSIPVWGVCHGTDLRQMAAHKLRREAIVRNIARLDKVCCLHENQRREVIACYGVPAEKTAVVGVGYNERIFYDRHIRAPHRDIRLIYAGKISEKKGVYSLISALDRLNLNKEDFTLRLAGGWNGSAQYEKARSLIDRSGWDVKLLGPLPQEKLAEELSAADVFVLPSFYEGLPLVLAEAMACGARVVCTNLPGIREWMDKAVPGNGIHFVPPPPMENTDRPCAGALEDFERALAAAITAAADDTPRSPSLSALSWQAVSKRILGE